MIAITNDYVSVFVWCLVLLVAIVAGFLLVSWFRKQLRQTDQPGPIGFSLADLRELHRMGKLSDAEFEKARSRMAAGLKHQALARSRDEKSG